MSYCTQADLIDRFGDTEITQLSDRSGLGALDSAIVAQAIADADAEIDGYLSGRYALPMASVPLVMTRLACDIARYWLFGQDVTDLVKARYDQAISYLGKVASGTITLGPDATGNEPASQTASALIQSDASAFASGIEDF